MRQNSLQADIQRYLREIAAEHTELGPEGTMISKAEALARLLWKKALGGKEVRRTAKGLEEVEVSPESWAILTIMDRLLGKAGTVEPDTGRRTTAADRVTDLARANINKLARQPEINARRPPPPPKLPK